MFSPALSDTILDGITRDSLLTIARNMGISVEERPVSVTEFTRALEEGRATEAFGAGTAAVIAPIASMSIDEEVYTLPPYSPNSLQNKLKDELEAIRTGKKEDRWGWNTILR